ncbi:MAG: RNA methyltransferase [Clostridia bacterium]|nr:RNA methyltransferase [Clostridia bacterium]
MKYIESDKNPKIKLINSLKTKKYREKEGLFFAEGERIVKDGIKKAEAEFIVLSASYAEKNTVDFNGDIYVVPDKLFSYISDTVNPQGIMGIFRLERQDAAYCDFSLNTLLLNGISDPGNMGTLIRTAEAADFKNIVIDKKSTDIFNPKTIRSTMSGVFNKNIYFCEDAGALLSLVKEKTDIYLLALCENSKNIFEEKFEKNCLLVVGNEANGIDRQIIDAGYRSVIIPMSGEIESLNAAVAGSIAMYEVYKNKIM